MVIFFKACFLSYLLELEDKDDEDIVVKETLTELEDTDVDNVDLFVVCLLRSLANCC